jgi:ATP/maltotriose-dependent transcriptional regulator MalT
MARACLGIADASLSAGQAESVVSWARQGLGYLNEAAAPELLALGSFLLGAGLLRTVGATEEAAGALTRAAQLANEHELTGIAARSQFELGNLRAQQGDLRAARQRMAEAVDRAKEARDPFQETLAHNNAAYYELQAGDLADAQRHVASGQALADTWGLEVPRQWLDSTQGEIALAESRWDDAEACFRQGMVVAERFHNREQAANYRANLALVARWRGDVTGAIALLEQARGEASDLGAAYLQARIDGWLAEIYLAAGEHTAAAAASARVPADRYPLLQQQVDRARRESEAR